MIVAKYIAVALLGYLLGSIPFGVIIGKRSARIDITEDLERDKAKERGNSDGQKFPEWGRQHIRMALSWCLGYIGAGRFCVMVNNQEKQRCAMLVVKWRSVMPRLVWPIT